MAILDVLKKKKDELLNQYQNRFNEAKSAVNFVRNIPNMDTGGGIRVRDVARNMPSTFLPAVRQTFSRQGLGSPAGLRESGKGVARSALNIGNQLYSLTPQAALTRKFAPRTEQINQNIIKNLNNRLASRGTEAQKALNEGFKFSADMAPYGAIEEATIKAGSKILPKLATSRAGQFALRRASDVVSGQILTPKDQMPGGSRLKQAGTDIIGGALMEGAGKIARPVVKATGNKLKMNDLAMKMDAPVPERYSTVQDRGRLYKPDVKEEVVPIHQFEQEATGGKAPVKFMNEKGVVTKLIDKQTGKLISWSTNSPEFAKRVQEGKLSFGLSIRKVKPSEMENRVVKVGKNKQIIISGKPEDLIGNTAEYNKKTKQVILNKERQKGVNIQETPMLGAPEKPLQLGTGQPTMALPEGKITVNNKKEYFKLKAQGKDVEYNNPLRSGEKPINLTENANDLNPELVREHVRANLQQKFDNLEKTTYGSATSDLQGGTKGAGTISTITRPIQEKMSGFVGAGLSSQNPIKRSIARGIRGLFGGSGNTANITKNLGKYRGGVQNAENLANDFMKLGDEMLPNKLSKEKVWSFLDPELSKVKVNETDLSPQELDAVKTLREASDLINDTNFAMGKISHETWLNGKDGKYITRAYEDFDLPPELSEAFSGGKGKLDLGQYKQRGDVNDWKQENAIKDPFYLASKRIQSTFQNKAITDYGNWLVNDKNLVSDIAKSGYTQLSDSPMWGSLSGKYVRKDILEGMRGFYFDSKGLQAAYDALKWYDQNPIRQTLKKTKTVFNPATRLGNQISNRVFAVFNGINPATFEKNMQTFAKGELKNNGQYARFLRQNGVLGNDMTKYELVQQLVKDGVEPGKLKKIDNFISDTYGAADDQSKLAAFKYWLDKGKTKEEALIKVRNGFQDYSKVGLYYDVLSRLPLVGKPFVRFQSELGRIIKNTALENPLGLGTVVGSIALMGYAGSKLSGESPEDRKTREGRFGVPVIPFTNIPLVFQTPYGEVNVARMFGMYETNIADTENKNLIQRVSKYLPADIPTNKEDALKMLGNDPVAGPLTSLITDTDFRGKSIADPNQNKYQPTTLTSGEQWANRAKYLGRSYNLPFVNDLINVGLASAGKTDQYGKERTTGQAVARAAGFKVEKFGPQEAQAQRTKDIEFAANKSEADQKKLAQLDKQFASGQIDEKTYNKRIVYIDKVKQPNNTAQASNGIINGSDGFKFINKDGKLTNGYDTLDEAKTAKNKDSFDKSGKKYQEIDGVFYYRDKNNKVQDKPISEIKDKKYELEYTLKLEQARRNNDSESWFKIQDEYIGKLETEYKSLDLDNPIDQLRAIEIQNKLGDVSASYSKYKSQGGFTKPKKGTKASVSLTNRNTKSYIRKPTISVSSPTTVGRVNAPQGSRITGAKLRNLR